MPQAPPSRDDRNTACLAIDFGTSNCLAFVATASTLVPVPLEGEAFTLPSMVFAAKREVTRETELRYREQAFFQTMKDGRALLIGSPARKAYEEDPLGGSLITSPKSFLGSRLQDAQLKQFRDVVSHMLGHIKAKAEAVAGTTLTRAVLGRPVKYHGGQDAQALGLMEEAARAVGFTQIAFYMEPIAAALEYEERATAESLLMVVDIGGGTTDCAIVRIGPERAKKVDRDADVLGYSGDTIGGTDFDQSLAWHAFSPLLGRGTLQKNGHPLPYALLYDAFSTRSVPAQQAFRQAGVEVRQLLADSQSPEIVRRFVVLHEHQLQLQLIQDAEATKIALSKTPSVEVALGYLETGLATSVGAGDLARSTRQWVERISKLARESLASAGTTPDTIFITGGMGLSPVVQEGLRDALGGERPFVYGDMLGSVGRGLGVRAQAILRG
jgi:hypothetical chaperone protein